MVQSQEYSKCHGNDLKVTKGYYDNYFIECGNCKNFDTRKYDNIKKRFKSLVKCDICKSTTTDIEQKTGLPDWYNTEDEFDYIKNKVLYKKCYNEHYDELEKQNEDSHNKHLIIEYMFDDDELKFWEEGDEWDHDDTIVCDIENYGYKKAYGKALKEMKSKYPKTTKFIDIDE